MTNRDSLNMAASHHRWRTGLTTLALAGLIGSAMAQTANQYTFAVSTAGNLDAMAGATELVGMNQDDAASAVTPIGFNFDYEGTVYTDFSVNSNGGMQLGGTQVTAYAMNYNLNTRPTVILPYCGDGTTASGSVGTVLMGTSPSQVRVIQWNVGMDYNAAVANITYQVWLYEGSNQIEFRYGAGSPTGTNSGGIQIAITGANPSNYLDVLSNLSATSGSTALFTTTNAWPGNGTVLTFTPPSPNCSTPAPGNTQASISSGCPGMVTALSMQTPGPGPGITYQWQSSPDGSTWTDISGATNSTYTSGPLAGTTWFQCNVTCSIGPVTVNSTPAQVMVTSPTPSYYTYTGTQYTEDFSTWQNLCSTNDVPDNYWTNSPAFGTGTWRASNTTAIESGWSDVGGWNYPYTSLPGLPAARFHSRQAPAGTTGSLDFHVDMSAGTGGELLRFDYINYFGGGTLKVLISTDGGANFTQSGATLTNTSSSSSELKEFPINSTSATTVIRIQGTTSGSGNDIGVDNFRILTITCAKPTAPTATVTAPGSVDIGWTCTGCTGNYFVEYGTTGFTPGTGTVAGPFSSSPATISGLANGSYQAYVRQDCGGNGVSENAGPVAFSMLAGDFCVNAIDLTTLPLGDWTVIGNTTGANNNIGTSACGADQTGPDLLFYRDVEAGATLSLGLWSYANRLSVAYGGSCPGTTSLACSPGGYFNLGGYVQMVNDYQTLIWTNTGCSTERVYVMADGLTTGGEVYVFNYVYTPPSGPFCASVNGVSVNTVNSGTGATVNWPAACSGNVIVEYGPAGFTPGIDANAGVTGTTVAVSGNSTTISGLSLDTPYDVYVRQDCGAGVYSANGSPTPFTLHNGDDCSRVIALSGTTGSVTLNTTGANNDVAFCNPGDTGGDLIMSYMVQDGYGIYFTSAPVAPYVGSTAVGVGASCPGSTLLNCTTGALDYLWVNSTGTTQTVYLVQDGSDEGMSVITWSYLEPCALLDSDGDGINDCDDSCPNFPGQNGDPCTDGGNPGIITNCACVTTCGGNEVVVNITVDYNALDLSWQITDAGNVVIASEALTMADDNTNYSRTVCLGSSPADACYGFKLMDSYGDGLSGMGNWELRTTSGKVLLRDDFATGSSTPPASPASPAYGSVHSFCLPEGPANIASTECGIFNNQQGNKVYCNKVTGATQYQFEFSDPDAGFIRRIVRTTNYVTFWDMVSNPLVPGVHYFARVRTNLAGPVANAHFGSGCDMGLAPTVPCSQLIMAPNYGHSCNETRAFNSNSSFIYATPVAGASQYQFRIFNAGEGYDQTFTRNTYILQLKWNSSVAPPLVNGSTYNVEVNVKVGTVWSGFCGTTCAITIDNGGNNNAFANMEQASFGETTLWPNPVRDGQVSLNIGGLKDAQQQISVDVQDIYGKQVYAKQYGNSGDRFNTILQLPSDITSGVYMVNITVNGERTVQRLSVIR